MELKFAILHDVYLNDDENLPLNSVIIGGGVGGLLKLSTAATGAEVVVIISFVGWQNGGKGGGRGGNGDVDTISLDFLSTCITRSESSDRTSSSILYFDTSEEDP